MNSARAFFLAFLGLLPAGSCAVAALPSTPSGVRIDVSATLTDAGEPTVRFALTNRSDTVIDVYTRDLPWGSVKSLTITAIEASYPGTVIPREPRLQLSIPQVVRIMPGETIDGKIELRSFFPDVKHHLSVDDVLVLWSFQLRTCDGEQSNRVVGVLEVPRVKSTIR